MQLDITSAIDPKLLWAFAIDTQPPLKRNRRLSRPSRNLQRFVITSCSNQAKAFGVKAGMRYSEAKALIPNLRVIICNR